jgi:hypothetical protein
MGFDQSSVWMGLGFQAACDFTASVKKGGVTLMIMPP